MANGKDLEIRIKLQNVEQDEGYIKRQIQEFRHEFVTVKNAIANDREVISYDLAVQQKPLSQYFLKPIMKIKLEEDHVLLIYEPFDLTLKEWIKGDDLIDGRHCTKGLLQIIRDIARGLKFLSTNNMSHGKFELDTIFIVDGRAKLVHMKEPIDDERWSLSVLIGDIFREKNINQLPRDITMFDNILLSQNIGPKPYFHLVDHPIFLNWKGKLNYFLESCVKFNYDGGSAMAIRALKNITKPDILTKVKSVCELKDIEVKVLQNPEVSAYDFLNFARNVFECINDCKHQQYTFEEIYGFLDQVWPDFIFQIDRVFLSESFYVSVHNEYLQ